MKHETFADYPPTKMYINNINHINNININNIDHI